MYERMTNVYEEVLMRMGGGGDMFLGKRGKVVRSRKGRVYGDCLVEPYFKTTMSLFGGGGVY